MATFLVTDETINGITLHTIPIFFESTTVTLRAIITARVEKEVERYNSKLDKTYLGLVTPTSFEKTLNEPTTFHSQRLVDAEKQIYVAMDGFVKNQFVVLINDRQIEDLEEEFNVSAIDKISFIKIMPLVGG